jgi:Lar family restriction alleviation protein
MAVSELKPCPFCGRSTVHFGLPSLACAFSGCAQLVCDFCQGKGPAIHSTMGGDKRLRAIAAWNTRKEQQP